jgi:hypothetical protein
MKLTFWSYIVAVLLTLHCMGATQLVSAYAKDKASFVRMLTMTEEETKKEKDTKGDDDNDHEFKYRQKIFYSTSLHSKIISQFVHRHEQAICQFINELTTPPPDCKA